MRNNAFEGEAFISEKRVKAINETVYFREYLDKINVFVYNGGRMIEGGAEMTSKELLSAAFKATHTTQVEATAKVGWTPQQYTQRMARNSIRADEFLDILDAIGVDVQLTVRATGNPVMPDVVGAGRRVKRMVNGIVYDTKNANALANNFYADGKHKYNDGRARELYIDREGRYFFVEYSENENERDRVNPVSGFDAADFIERYGTEIHKEPADKPED